MREERQRRSLGDLHQISQLGSQEHHLCACLINGKKLMEYL
jgi:hypothetical protein